MDTTQVEAKRTVFTQVIYDFRVKEIELLQSIYRTLFFPEPVKALGEVRGARASVELRWEGTPDSESFVFTYQRTHVPGEPSAFEGIKEDLLLDVDEIYEEVRAVLRSHLNHWRQTREQEFDDAINALRKI